MGALENRNTTPSRTGDQPLPAKGRVTDILIFTGIFILCSIALATIAVAAPIILAISVLAGIFFRNGDGNRWRTTGVSSSA